MTMRHRAALACAALVTLAALPARAADPPSTAQQPAAPTAPALPGLDAVMGDKDKAQGGPLAEKPSLLKELPIAAYVTAPVSAIGGSLLFALLGGNAIKDLKDPTKHTTPDETHSLVVKARVGQVVGGVLFAFTGLSTAWGTFKTIRTLMKFSKMVQPPKIGVTALPGGLAFGVKGDF